MKYAAVPVLVIVLISSLALFFYSPPATAGTLEPVSINLPYCEEASSASLSMVAGVYHNLTVNAGHDFSSVNVSIFRDETFFYFLYSNGTWSSPSGNESLLDKTNCSVSDSSALFRLGLPLGSISGEWNLSVYVDGSEFYNAPLALEVPYPHFSMSSPDFVFRVDPFTNEVLYPTVDTYRVHLVNPGNVPLEIHPEFESFERMFGITNASGIFTPLEQRDLHLSFSVPSWSPRIIRTHVSIVGTPLFIIPAKPGTANINSSFKQSFNVEIDVVRQGYELIDLGDVTVQYKKTLYADYNTDIGLDLFFTGVKDISLSVGTESIRLDGITLENESVSSPVFIPLTNTTERHLHLSLNTSSPQITAMVDYNLETVDSSISRDFHTEVVVGPRPLKPFDSGVYINIIGISVFLIFIIVLLAYSFVLYRRHKKEEKEVEGKAIHRARKGAERRVKVKRYTPSHPRKRGGTQKNISRRR